MLLGCNKKHQADYTKNCPFLVYIGDDFIFPQGNGAS